MEGLRRLAASIHRFLGDAPADAPFAPSLKMLSSRSVGGTWLLDQLWQKLGIGKAIARRLQDRGFRAPMERALFAMVANRALDPSSKLAVEDWVARNVVIPNLPTFDVHHGYRAMDFLLESEESIQHEVFQAVADLLNLEVKEVVVGVGEARKRYVLVRNPEEAKRDALKRENHLAHLQEERARLKELDGEAHTKAHCHLVSHRTYKRYLKVDKRGNLRLDRPAIKAMERLDGKYLLRTSDDTLSTEDVALGYKQLLKVEAAFRTLKSSLSLRPVYHRKEERIRAHVLLCWLALMLIRIVENQTGKTWREVRSYLQEMHVVEYQYPDGTVKQRTELTQEQKAIVSALNLDEPPKLWDISTHSHENR